MSPLRDAGPTCSLLFHCTGFCVILIYSLGSVSLSTRLQFVFSENCSTCRCIFDMFVRGGDLSILLWCHHDLHSTKTFSLALTSKIPCCTSIPFYGVLREVTARICQSYLFVSKIINLTFRVLIRTTQGDFFQTLMLGTGKRSMW